MCTVSGLVCESVFLCSHDLQQIHASSRCVLQTLGGVYLRARSEPVGGASSHPLYYHVDRLPRLSHCAVRQTAEGESLM